MKKSLLLLSVFFAISLNAQTVPDCSELFFSEYVEGYGQDKAMEIYNPTSSPADLGAYKIERYSNGSTNSSAGGITSFTGVLASGDAFVLTNGDTDTSGAFGYIDMMLYNMGDMAEPNGSYPTPMHMNGNDALVLTKNGVIIDVFGRVGEDPGVCWTDNAASGFQSGDQIIGFNPGTWYTTGHTLIRKNTVLKGDLEPYDLFNPSLEWDTLPVGTWANLGSHTCDCLASSNIMETNLSYVIYPNPVNLGSTVNIKATERIKQIIVTNILGQQTNFTNTIRTNSLSKGTYNVSIEFVSGKVIDNKLVVE